MKKPQQIIEFHVRYFLHETSCPSSHPDAPNLSIKMDPRSFDAFSHSKTAHEIGNWLIYEVTNERVRMSHTKYELFEAVYLRSNIN